MDEKVCGTSVVLLFFFFAVVRSLYNLLCMRLIKGGHSSVVVKTLACHDCNERLKVQI